MEGPSLVILKEELQPFVRKRVTRLTGQKQKEFRELKGTVLRGVRSWGKHLLLFFPNEVLRVHFLMFGSYRINDTRERPPRLSFKFGKSEVNLYSCAIKKLEAGVLKTYDWTVDIMSPEFDEAKAVKAIRARPKSQVCDILMDQTIFAGVGNIIKNEVLFRLRLHPELRMETLTLARCRRLVKETRHYCAQFYEWKKINQLKRNWRIFRKRKCPLCGKAVVKKPTGVLKRFSHFCPVDQPYA
jgi:endonuclease-8